MSWVQKLNPNLDNDPKHPLYVYQGGKILTDWYGWCLAVAAASFGAKGSSYSAKTAWQSCGTKHRDRNIPEYRWVPLWYEGGQYGHIVIGFRQGNSITIYSSPYTHKPTFDRFDGELNWALDYVGRVYGVGSFSGWSETLLDSRIIEWVEDKPQNQEPAENSTPQEPVEDGSDTKDDDTIVPEPEPISEPSDDATEPSDDNDDGKEDNMSSKEPFEPAKEADQQLIGGIIEEASDFFEPSKTIKLIAYLVGDALLVGAILIPDIVNAIQAPTMSIWAEYISKVLLEAGTCILLVFKLIKKKK